MELWDWFSENEKVLSGIAAAIVILGALAAFGRDFLLRVIRGSSANVPRQVSLSELSKPSPHRVQFADSDGVKIAYSVHGKPAPDLIVTPGIISNLHVSSNLRPLRETMRALSKFARIINFDKRGQGLSDPVPNVATLTERVKDIEAVADAADCGSFVLMGISEGGPMSVSFAVANPDRVKGLILFGTTPRFSRADDYAIGSPETALDAMAANWGSGAARDVLFPSISRHEIDDDAYRGMEKLLADKRSMKQIVEYMKTLDVRDILGEVRCPTLVVHFSGDLAVSARMGRYLAGHIPGAEYLEIAGVDHCDLASAPEAVKAIRAFVEKCAA